MCEVDGKKHVGRRLTELQRDNCSIVPGPFYMARNLLVSRQAELCLESWLRNAHGLQVATRVDHGEWTVSVEKTILLMQRLTGCALSSELQRAFYVAALCAQEQAMWAGFRHHAILSHFDLLVTRTSKTVLIRVVEAKGTMVGVDFNDYWSDVAAAAED